MQYMWRRILRIFPAFWVLLGVTAFVVGPLLWILTNRDPVAYFTGSAHTLGTTPYEYVAGNSLLYIKNTGIYNLFETNPYGNVVNGSLWTLIKEWECYLFIGVALSFGLVRFSQFVVPLLFMCFGLGIVLNDLQPTLLPQLLPDILANSSFIKLGFVFLLGAVIAVFSSSFSISRLIALACAGIVVLTFLFGLFNLVGVPAFAYLTLFLGARLPAQLHRIGQRNDYSYGIYIYGFLIQQSLSLFGINRWGYVPYLGIALALSFGCAWLSWHFIEKRCMRLKNWGPGKGINFWKTHFQRLPAS